MPNDAPDMPMPEQAEVLSFEVNICRPCVNLEPSECHTPGCRFFLMGIDEIREYLSRLLIRVDFEDSETFIAEPILANDAEHIGRLEAENRALQIKLDEMQKVKKAVQSALENVYALVEGESPSLMEDDHNFEKAYEAIQLANDFDASNPPADQPKEKA